MSTLIPSQPQNLVIQTGNAQIFITWDQVVGAVTYDVQRSTTGLVGSFTSIAAAAVNTYLDTSVTPGVQYWYQIASTNAGGTSGYANTGTNGLPLAIVPCLPGQINLGYLKYQSKLKADKLNSNFLTEDEWGFNVNQSIFELYDILVTKFGDDYVMAPSYVFTTTGAIDYPLPDGSPAFQNTVSQTAPAIYKLLGVDCGVAVGNNAWVTLPKYNWIDRNKFVYPQLTANALGVFNLSYRQMGNSLFLLPRPSAGQYIQVWYVPMMTQLLKDTDMMSFSISGWSELVMLDAAIKALLKEESFEQAQMLQAEKDRQMLRIETTAANRDIGQPNTVSDTRSNTGFYNGGGYGGNGSGMAGW